MTQDVESLMALTPPWQTLAWPALDTSLQVLRLDQIDPVISGNKSYKLGLNLRQAQAQAAKQVISFGGAYSNHIHALAAAGQALGLKTLGVIRGEPHYASNPCLADAQAMGMQLHFVDRKTYAKRYQAEYWQGLEQQFGASYIVPEGGANVLGSQGCQPIAEAINRRFKTACDVFIASGTGTTAVGIASALQANSRLHVVNVLPQPESFEQDFTRQVAALNPAAQSTVSFVNAYHLGGYAKFNSASVALMDFAQQQWQLPLEPIYTAKAFSAFIDHAITQHERPQVFIHSGGLQGLRGCHKKIDSCRRQDGYQSSLARYQTAILDAREEGVLCPI